MRIFLVSVGVSIGVIAALSPVIESGPLRLGLSIAVCAVVGTWLEMRSKKE